MDDFAVHKLAENACKPLRTLIQLDGWAPWPGETVRQVSGGITREFQKGSYPIRCYISPFAKREDVLTLLDEMRDWIVSSPVWPMFTEPTISREGNMRTIDRPDIYPDVKLADPEAALRQAAAAVKDLEGETAEQVRKINAVFNETAR